MARNSYSTIPKGSRGIKRVQRNYCFEGTERNTHNDDKLCDYCQKYYNKELYLDNINYCINCWSIMDSDNLDYEKLIYKSDTIKIETVMAFIKKYYEQYIEQGLHEDRDDCIFNKIEKAKKDNTLHFLLDRELNTGTVSYKMLDEYKLFIKNRNPKINFNVSAIDI
jgi:hypothetical protein